LSPCPSQFTKIIDGFQFVICPPCASTPSIKLISIVDLCVVPFYSLVARVTLCWPWDFFCQACRILPPPAISPPVCVLPPIFSHRKTLAFPVHCVHLPRFSFTKRLFCLRFRTFSSFFPNSPPHLFCHYRKSLFRPPLLSASQSPPCWEFLFRSTAG